MKIFSHIIR